MVLALSVANIASLSTRVIMTMKMVIMKDAVSVEALKLGQRKIAPVAQQTKQWQKNS